MPDWVGLPAIRRARRANLYDYLCKHHPNDVTQEGDSLRLNCNHSVSLRSGWSGYLLTVQNWLDRPELHRYAFSTIAWRAMSSAVSNERRKQQRRIRAVSLDAPLPGAGGPTLGDTVTADNSHYIPYRMEAV